MKRFLFYFLITSSTLFCQKLDEVINGDHRSAKNKARDIYRNPLKTLQYFGLKNDMTVVELNPGGGWYQEILAPFLNAKGNSRSKF